VAVASHGGTKRLCARRAAGLKRDRHLRLPERHGPRPDRAQRRI